jgi:integrase
MHPGLRLSTGDGEDLRKLRFVSGRPSSKARVFAGVDIDNWRAREWARAVSAAEVGDATPYTLRRSFASLLLAEGHSGIYVARP